MSSVCVMSEISSEFGATFSKGGLNATVYVSEQLNRQMVNMSQDLAYRCVAACAERYNFDAEEAYRLLGLAMVKLERKAEAKVKAVKVAKVSVPKAAFPLPYNGEFNEACCYALRQNNGLYTQCSGVRKGEAHFCKSCATTMQKTGAELPEYGTIQQRMAVGILEYVDPKGRKPIAYTKIMKKYKINEEQVLEEAGKFNITINPIHFEVGEPEGVKRGRPSSKAEKEVKAKGVKGRPKKDKKVIMIEGDEEDLFATLVANAAEDSEEEDVVQKEEENAAKLAAEKKEKAAKLAAEKEEKAAKLAAEKAEKAAKLAAEKAEKAAKLEAEKAEKAAKLEAERLAKEAKKKAEEEEKAAKKAAAEKAKAEKEAKKSKKVSKPEPEPEPEEEPESVKKITFEGKKYLKSMKSGVIYDYDEYVKSQEQVVLGKWNNATNKIDFVEQEEEEEEYDM